jgi:hypothetical protein
LACLYYLYEKDNEHYETIVSEKKSKNKMLILTVNKSADFNKMMKTVKIFNDASYELFDNAERLINNDNAESLINNDNAERLINNDNRMLLKKGHVNKQIMLCARDINNNFDYYHHEILDEFIYDCNAIIYNIEVDDKKISLGNLDNIPNDLRNKLSRIEILFY